MLNIDIVKQAFENNSNKNISSLLLKKAVISSIKRGMNIEIEYSISSIIEDILKNEILSEEEKAQLFIILKDRVYKDYEETKKNLDDLFGSTKEEE